MSSWLLLALRRSHGVTHLERGGDRPIGRREGRHHGVADGLDHRAALQGDDLLQRAKVCPHQIEGRQIADAVVELGGALEVGEQKRQAGDLEALVHVQRAGAVDVEERLVGEQALGRQKRPAPPEELVERVARDPQGRQHPHLGSILNREAQRPGTQRDGRPGRRMHPVDGERERLTLTGRLALHIEELGRVRHRVEDDHELRRQLQRQNRLFAGRELDGLERDLVDQPREILGQINPGTPEDLTKILREVEGDRDHAPLLCEPWG